MCFHNNKCFVVQLTAKFREESTKAHKDLEIYPRGYCWDKLQRFEILKCHVENDLICQRLKTTTSPVCTSTKSDPTNYFESFLDSPILKLIAFLLTMSGSVSENWLNDKRGIKISRRRTRHFRDRKKAEGKLQGKRLQINTPRIHLRPRFLFHPTDGTRRAANDESWMRKHQPTHSSQSWFVASKNRSPLKIIKLSSISFIFSRGFFTSFRFFVAETEPRNGFHTFLLQVPTKRTEPEMKRHTRSANVIVMKKIKYMPIPKALGHGHDQTRSFLDSRSSLWEEYWVMDTKSPRS